MPYKLLNVAEFLNSCPNDHRHYQLFDGIMVAMAPPWTPAQIASGRLIGEIASATIANRPDYSARVHAGIAPDGVEGRDYFETDLTVTREAVSPRNDSICREPLLIVEILSPGTDRDDVFIKLPAYQRIPSLHEILYVETDRVAATVYRRGEQGWVTIAVGREDRLCLETAGLDIPLATLYRRIPGLSP